MLRVASAILFFAAACATVTEESDQFSFAAPRNKADGVVDPKTAQLVQDFAKRHPATKAAIGAETIYRASVSPDAQTLALAVDSHESEGNEVRVVVVNAAGARFASLAFREGPYDMTFEWAPSSARVAVGDGGKWFRSLLIVDIPSMRQFGDFTAGNAETRISPRFDHVAAINDIPGEAKADTCNDPGCASVVLDNVEIFGSTEVSLYAAQKLEWTDEVTLRFCGQERGQSPFIYSAKVGDKAATRTTQACSF